MNINAHSPKTDRKRSGALEWVIKEKIQSGGKITVLLKSPSRDWRPHVELAIHWSLANVQRVMALVVTGAECSLGYGKPEQFPGPSAYIDGYGSQIM